MVAPATVAMRARCVCLPCPSSVVFFALILSHHQHTPTTHILHHPRLIHLPCGMARRVASPHQAAARPLSAMWRLWRRLFTLPESCACLSASAWLALSSSADLCFCHLRLRVRCPQAAAALACSAVGSAAAVVIFGVLERSACRWGGRGCWRSWIGHARAPTLFVGAARGGSSAVRHRLLRMLARI